MGGWIKLGRKGVCVGKGGENYKFTSAKLLFLDPKYVWRQKCCKKRGEFRTEFTISSSKIFPEIEKYNPSTKNISYKKCWKKMGDFVHNRSEPESSWTSTPHLPCIYPKPNSNKTSFSFPYCIVIPFSQNSSNIWKTCRVVEKLFSFYKIQRWW